MSRPVLEPPRSLLRLLESELWLHKLIVDLDKASEILVRNSNLSSVDVKQEPRDLRSNDRLHEHLGPRRQEEWVVSAPNAASKAGVWVRKYSWKVG